MLKAHCSRLFSLSAGPGLPGVRWVLAAGLCLPMVAIAQQRATPVEVDAVRVAQSAQTLPILASVIAPESGPIAARTQGTIAQFNVQVGDTVKAGDTLAVLDRQIQRSQVAQARAALSRAEAQQALAANQLDRISRLRDSSAFEESLYDTRAAELEVAKADAQAARVQLSSAQTDYGWGTVEAPFPGVVTARHTNTGAWVNRGSPVVDLVNTAALEIAADIPAAKLAGIAPGVVVTVKIGDANIPAKVRAVVPNENPSTRTRQVRIVPDSADSMRGVAANSSATVLLPVGGARDLLTVHKDAILRSGEQASVYVVKEGKTVPTPVVLGDAVGSRLAVISGLSDGDLVVTRGNERLRPGQAVSYPGQEAAGGADS